jgi:hypothetical protein
MDNFKFQIPNFKVEREIWNLKSKIAFYTEGSSFLRNSSPNPSLFTQNG